MTTEPIVFISRNKVKPGMEAAFRAHYQDSIPPIEAGKPGTLVQLSYDSDDGAEVVVVRLFPDAAALDEQLQGAGETLCPRRRRGHKGFWPYRNTTLTSRERPPCPI